MISVAFPMCWTSQECLSGLCHHAAKNNGELSAIQERNKELIILKMG